MCMCVCVRTRNVYTLDIICRVIIDCISTSHNYWSISSKNTKDCLSIMSWIIIGIFQSTIWHKCIYISVHFEYISIHVHNHILFLSLYLFIFLWCIVLYQQAVNPVHKGYLWLYYIHKGLSQLLWRDENASFCRKVVII